MDFTRTQVGGCGMSDNLGEADFMFIHLRGI